LIYVYQIIFKTSDGAIFAIPSNNDTRLQDRSKYAKKAHKTAIIFEAQSQEKQGLNMTNKMIIHTASPVVVE
jgi:hypothetical protein